MLRDRKVVMACSSRKSAAHDIVSSMSVSGLVLATDAERALVVGCCSVRMFSSAISLLVAVAECDMARERIGSMSLSCASRVMSFVGCSDDSSMC